MARRKLLNKSLFSDFVILIARGHAEIGNIFNLADSEIINFKNKLAGDVITDYEILLNKNIVFEALNNAKSSRYDLKSSIDEISDISFYDIKFKAESLGMIYIDESKDEKKRLRKKEATKVKFGWLHSYCYQYCS